MIDRRFTDHAHWQEAAGYSRAVRSGSRIVVSGTTASAPDGSASTGAASAGSDPGDETYRQTLDALTRGLHAVQELGGTAADVVRTRVFLVPRADWRGAARAHREVFDAVRPANTMLFVSALVGDDLLVEVELDAEVGDAPAGHAAGAGAGAGPVPSSGPGPDAGSNPGSGADSGAEPTGDRR